MKHGTISTYRISNNFRSTRSGSKRAVAPKKAENSAKTTELSDAVPTANDEAKKAKPAEGTPAQKPKRRDVKATPTSHTMTKASELAKHKDDAEEPEADPIAGISSGAGGSTSNQAPVDRDELASSSKVLFGDEEGGKKTEAPRKSFYDFSTQEEALEVALLPLLQCPPHHLLRRPVEAKLAWVDKIHLGREYLLARKAPPAIRGFYRRRFINGGLLARLRRSKNPPPLRTTDRVPMKVLLSIDREDD